MQISSDTLLWGASTSLSASLDMKFLLQNLSTVTPKDGLTFYHTFPSRQSSSRYATYITGQNDFSVGGGKPSLAVCFLVPRCRFCFRQHIFCTSVARNYVDKSFFSLSILG